MSAILQLECLSHTPLQGLHDPAPDVLARVQLAQHAARQRVESFAPDLVILFSPDHYNGFFYDMMPPWCVGAAATAIGDFGSLAGKLDVPISMALNLVRYLDTQDVNAALSYRMEVDHGCAQALEVLTGSLTRYPVIPIFINSVAPPMPSCRRVIALGEAVGRFAATSGKRVLIAGSGGLSHEPPVPELAGAPREVAERLIAGRHPGPDAREQRQARTLAAAQAFTAGEGAMQPLNPEWDRALLQDLTTNYFDRIAQFEDEGISRVAGKSAHEVRTWIAACSAMAAAGGYRGTVDFYEPIPEWIAGFGMMHAGPVPEPS